MKAGKGATKAASKPGSWKRGSVFTRDGAAIFFDRAENLYDAWPRPIAIIADGPYGVGGFPGDPPTAKGLPAWYLPHIKAWSRRATPQTTLWFWCTELGWASVHATLEAEGWEYRCCHTWNKGLSHVAGNANAQTLRKFPVVTEVCVQYVRASTFRADGCELSMQQWLRREWLRTGLPLKLANEATGTVNAATRKYLTSDHLWYFPPPAAFRAMAEFANKHGDPRGRPYFSADGRRPISGRQWAKMRAKFHCIVGVNNVWTEPQVRGPERLKKDLRGLHRNQKPHRLIDLCIASSTDRGDVVWEPFGGLCTAAVSAHSLGRRCFSAEVVQAYFLAAKARLATYDRAGDPPRPGGARRRGGTS